MSRWYLWLSQSKNNCYLKKRILKDDYLFNISVHFLGINYLVKNLNRYYIKPEIEYDEKKNQINIDIYGNDIILYPSN